VAEVLLSRSPVEQRVTYEGDQVRTFGRAEIDRAAQPVIEPREEWFDRTHPIREVLGQAGFMGIVSAC
jgi:hypothetical protein